jgi:hypothetical protein
MKYMCYSHSSSSKKCDISQIELYKSSRYSKDESLLASSLVVFNLAFTVGGLDDNEENVDRQVVCG